MANYKILIKPSAVKEIEDLPKDDLKRVTKKILDLGIDPRPQGSEKLSGQERYRLRQGNYRIVYEIEQALQVVRVVKIGHRKEVYP